MPIRIKLVIMSLLFLAIPSLLIGIIGYQSSANSLNTLGAEGLQTDVRMTIAMIGALQKQVVAGKVSLAEAQEEVKAAILGKKDKDGKRPINPRLNLGQHGFLFIINSQGLEIAHPNFEGKNVWNIKLQTVFILLKKLLKLPTMAEALLPMNGHCLIAPIFKSQKLPMPKKIQNGIGSFVPALIYQTLMQVQIGCFTFC